MIRSFHSLFGFGCMNSRIYPHGLSILFKPLIFDLYILYWKTQQIRLVLRHVHLERVRKIRRCNKHIQQQHVALRCVLCIWIIIIIIYLLFLFRFGVLLLLFSLPLVLELLLLLWLFSVSDHWICREILSNFEFATKHNNNRNNITVLWANRVCGFDGCCFDVEEIAESHEFEWYRQYSQPWKSNVASN